MECPIGLPKTHCQNCFFWRDGKCDYDKIMQEMEHRETMERISDSSARGSDRANPKLGEPG